MYVNNENVTVGTFFIDAHFLFLNDNSRKLKKTIGADGDVYSRPESKKANGYNAPANNKSFESICDVLCMYCIPLFSQ